jgi:hypothetical protein
MAWECSAMADSPMTARSDTMSSLHPSLWQLLVQHTRRVDVVYCDPNSPRLLANGKPF